MICIFLHIYYPGSLPELLPLLRPLLRDDDYLFINLVQDTHRQMPEIPKQENIIVTRSTNKGKDVGGKLLLLDLYLRLGIKSEYMIFLHDKQSPHAATSGFWKTELYRIIEPEQVLIIQSVFNKAKKVGLAGSKRFIQNEWNTKTKLFETTNHAILLELLNQYRFLINDYSFVAGTMFWVRSCIYETFFLQHAPLAIRAMLEEGDVLDLDNGSFTHAWERLFSWIATAQGYKLYGI